MATRRTAATPETPEVEAKYDFSAVAADAVPTTLPKTEAPNALLDNARWTLENDQAMKITIPAGAVKAAENLIRRAAKTLEAGQKMRTVALGDGYVEFSFQLLYSKRTRRYSQDDVREWAKSQGAADDVLYPRVHKDVSKAYRVANGFQKED